MLRLLHWSMALAVIVLLLTAWTHELFEKGLYEKAVWLIHIDAGYVLGVAFTLRLVWGIVGPRHARFSALWHPSAWLAALRKPKIESVFRLGRRYGHHPMASLAYIGFYGLVLVMIVTGLGLAALEHSTGPLATWLSDSVWLEDLFEEPHEVISVLLASFIGLHLGAMILHERLEGVPVSQAMVSGYQYRKEQEEDDQHED